MGIMPMVFKFYDLVTNLVLELYEL